MEKKILTRELVKELGLNKVSVITADMFDGYTSIGSYAFYECYGLTSVTIPNSVTNIIEGAFHGCSGLTSVTIPDSITSIGSFAFDGCSGLTSVTIPNSVTSIGCGAFYGCSGLTSIIVESGNVVYDSRNNCNAIIETATNTLVAGCQSTIIPNSVASIGKLAFSNCTSLTSVSIPNSVITIGGGAFSYCTSLTSVTIPNSVTSIGDLAFSGCSSLPVIDNIRYADIYLVEAVDKTLSTYTIKEGTRFIGDYAFRNCSGLATIDIPNSITSIGDLAFDGCSGLTSVTIPNSVTSIGDWAFSGCYGLTSVTIGGIEYKPKTVINSKCKAYKAFNTDMKCRGFQYKEGETYEFDGEPKLCKCGFHACLNLADVFNYYAGELGKDVVVYEVKLEGVSYERQFDSKVVAKKITIGKRIL